MGLNGSAGALGNNSGDSLSAVSCNWPPDQIFDVTVENTPTSYADLIGYPILLFICTFGNLLSIVALSTDVAKSTTNVYLICLAVSDLCVIWLALEAYIPEADVKVRESDAYFQNVANFSGFQKWWEETAIQFSDWTLIVFSLERLIAIARPFEYRHRLTVRRAIYIELGVLFLASICALENLVVGYYFLAHDDGVSTKTRILTPGLLEWDRIQNQAEVGITLAKWVILTILNVCLIIVISRHNKIRDSILVQTEMAGVSQSTPNKSSAVHPARRHSTYVLMCCSGLYFVTQFPNVIYKILEVASRPPYCSYNFTYKAKMTARPIVYVILLSNYSVNFLLYCLLWRKFREQLRYLLFRTLEKTGLSTPSTALTTAGTTPEGNTRSAKMSLQSETGVRTDISPLLLATTPNPKLAKMGLDPIASSKV
ncbi:hypothetical protein BV898_01060 [Hypsibius exemplaris]|uniref:G-protein coupled receptors family 1 profile domain-containing protein n=1 Tax=Hypsibius exemplaris TaxID=2072580 RepID=A0A1W0XDD8_HYPEX|nr:hypothetical protein BV898_01060 [Hypsibius exemplaris]